MPPAAERSPFLFMDPAPMVQAEDWGLVTIRWGIGLITSTLYTLLCTCCRELQINRLIEKIKLLKECLKYLRTILKQFRSNLLTEM